MTENHNLTTFDADYIWAAMQRKELGLPALEGDQELIEQGLRAAALVLGTEPLRTLCLQVVGEVARAGVTRDGPELLDVIRETIYGSPLGPAAINFFHIATDTDHRS